MWWFTFPQTFRRPLGSAGPRAAQAPSDLSSPERLHGYVDLARVDAIPPDDQRLPKPHVVDSRFSRTSDRCFSSYDEELAGLGLRVISLLRFLPPGGAVRAFECTGDPGLIRLDPRWY